MRNLILILFLALTFLARSQEAASQASIRADLEAMFATDQAHRREVIELEKKHGKNSTEVKEAWSKQGVIDAQNIRRLEDIIAQHGWPGRKLFGDKAASGAFLVLQHSDFSYQKKYLPLARNAAANGDLWPSSLALLEDRVRLRDGLKQLYGSQVTRNSADEWEPLPLEDEEKVDSLRASVGLGPIFEYLQGFASRSGGHVSLKWIKKPAEILGEAPRSGAVTPRATEGTSK